MGSSKMSQANNVQSWRWSGWLAAAVVGGFAIATLLLTRANGGGPLLSPLSGLMALKATAQIAMPYDQALANARPTLVEFYADWCTTCQAMAPTLQALHDQYGPQINFVMLDIDDPLWSEPVEQFQVKGVPQLTLLRADQTVADTLIGKVPKPLLAEKLGALLNS